MQTRHYIPSDFEKAFGELSSGLDFDSVKYPKCIAYENLGGYDYRIVYEFYIDGQPRFFYFSNLEAPFDIKNELEATKKWTRTTRVKIIDSNENQFLFELIEPFDIQFGTIT